MDDRARVPFALLGVLLLVSSATLAATIQPRRPPTDGEVAVTIDQTTASTQTTVRESVVDASEAAAANPVIEPADTTAGAVLNDSTAFRDALRLRIYLTARQRLGQATAHQGDVTTTASLPGTGTERALRDAKRRVRIEQVGENETTLRVTLHNITLTTRRNDRVLHRRTITPTVAVQTPVLPAHERVQTYQQRLDAGVTKPGLSQRLTAQLYALAWSRGYVQYSGVPIQNVVSNQHVGVATNAALLKLQRSTIGHSDPRGRHTLGVAAARATTDDLTVATGRDSRVTKALLDGPTKPADSEIQGVEKSNRTGPDDETRIGVNGTADSALLAMLDDSRIERTINSTYSIEARAVTHVETERRGTSKPPTSPGNNWTKVGERQNQTQWNRNVTIQPPSTAGDWHPFETYSRQTITRTETGYVWERRVETANGSKRRQRTTWANETAVRNISVAVVGRHTGGTPAPNRPISTAHERGAGPLSGPNLAGVRERAIRRTINGPRERDDILDGVVTGTLGTANTTISLAQPDTISEWVYRDLMTFREQVRAVNVTMERGKIGTYEENPPAALAKRLEQRRAALLDAPARYDSAATKARVAVRAAYLDAVSAKLEARAEDRRDHASSFDAALQDSGTSLDSLQDGLEARERPPAEHQPRLDGLGGPVRLSADTAPAYLTQARLTSEQIPAVDGRSHPLVVRNINVFSVPHQQATDSAVDGLFGTNSGVRLDTAARTLNATNATVRTLNTSALDDSTVRSRRQTANETTTVLGAVKLRRQQLFLRNRVATANRYVMRGQQSVLADSAGIEGATIRRLLVEKALLPWNTTHARALALANGSATRRLVTLTGDHANLSVAQRDKLAMRLNASLSERLQDEKGRPDTDTVNESRSATHLVARELAREVASRKAAQATKRAYGKALKRSFGAMPSGLPLAPAPSYWYATMNVWHVDVRGEYARFGVRASQGRPTTPGGEFSYVRDGAPVTLDVNQDGRPERLGRATRVSFNVSATVPVVVPPGKTGVGDVNGVTVEQSSGWPDPGGE
ncbi:hypothetical protein BRC91_08980 [Halobacteriales archaeon QS_4_62_28]|nr:MAG: hypothetical protein BRC91_08980 [Halobacteriales archaeon QS_4_62_28]